MHPHVYMMQLQDVLEGYKEVLPPGFRMSSTDDGVNIFAGKKKHHTKLDTHHVTVDKVRDFVLLALRSVC